MSKITMPKRLLLKLFSDMEKHNTKGITLEKLDQIDKQSFFLNKLLDVIVISFGVILFFLSQKFLFLILLIPYILYFYKK